MNEKSKKDKESKPKLTIGRGLEVSNVPGFGVVFDTIQLEHYCQRIEEMDMPNLDEANFLTASLSVAISMLVALLGVAFGTDDPAGWVLLLFGALFLAASCLSYYYKRKYDKAKATIKKSGKVIARELREISAAQRGTQS